jgi:hypothetical protein
LSLLEIYFSGQGEEHAVGRGACSAGLGAAARDLIADSSLLAEGIGLRLVEGLKIPVACLSFGMGG